LKNSQKYIRLLTFFSILLNISYLRSQSVEKLPLYDYFDNSVGKQNLNINNGVIHSEPFRPITNKNRYYIDEFIIGDLSFEGEIYTKINLKYDIYDDQIIYKQNDQTDNLSIALIKHKVDFFIIKNTKFVNLKSESIKFPRIVKGILEEGYVGNEISLYIKHRKEKLEVLQSDGVYYNFIYKTDYIIKYNNIFYKIDSEKDIKKIFPSYKKEIRNYFKKNERLEQSDKKQFVGNLTKEINDLLNKVLIK
jgi:hypothetical protein